VSHPSPSPRDQIAFLRSLAVAGQETPLSSGPYLIAGGHWFGFASLVHWTVAIGLLALPPRAYGLIWIVAAVGICIFCVWISLWLASSRRGVNCEALPARPTTSPAGDSP
jgi:hypothetical protein